MLLLDLDDTIFETASIPHKVVEPAIVVVRTWFETEFGIEKANQIISALWKLPFDIVSRKYEIPNEVQADFFRKLDAIDYNLDIRPFDDYPELLKIPKRKILVTTGFLKLQNAKIDALKIRNDFEAIYIDDPREKNRRHKKGIFESILKNTNLPPSEFWVIGDNPNSELKAGRELGMRTVQRLKISREKSEVADFGIFGFEELGKLIIRSELNKFGNYKAFR